MRSRLHRWVTVCLVAAALCLPRSGLACVGDCNGDAVVTIDELIRAVQVALGLAPLSTCDAADNDRDGTVSIGDLVRGVNKGLTNCAIGASGDVLVGPQSKELDEYDLATGATTDIVPSTRAAVHGQPCLFPDGSGNYAIGSDDDPAGGWAIFSPDGTLLQRLPLPLLQTPFGVAIPPGVSAGCAVDASGRVFGTAVGNGGGNGQLWVYFPPDYAKGCLLDWTLDKPGAMAIDGAGALYVPNSGSTGSVLRFAPPFPDSLDACPTDAPPALPHDAVIQYGGDAAPTAVARDAQGHWFVADGGVPEASLPGIHEHAADGTFLRELFAPGSAGDPAAVAVDSAGTVYYADPGVVSGTTQAGAGTLRKVAFAADGTPVPPELLASGLTAPDGLAVMSSRAEEWLTLGGSLRRTYFNPRERAINTDTASKLVLKWRYPTSGMISAQAAVVWLDLPGEGRTQVVIVPSWDRHVYALRAENGSRVWQYEMKPQPGAFFTYSASPTIAWLNGQARVYVPGGETLYCLDAVSGQEIWTFDAGSGCTDCTARQERNEIEATPAVINGLVIVGMDVNDSPPGNGGVFAVRADDGRLVWWFDLFNQATCRPLADDNVHRFDSYHTAEQLGLPGDFFATRPGCNFDRTGYGCGNVWSSPAVDAGRGLLYTVSSNCDTDDDPSTPLPPSPPPPFEEAIFALHLDGTPAWHWRPREVDPDDLDFGAVPNLFEATIGGAVREVVGVGGKDGTYYVLDRDGVNAITGKVEPYWQTNVVPGGPAGGMIGAASVGEGRVVVATAAGFSVFQPQKPSVHAFDASTGAVLWENSDVDTSFGPTMGAPGLAFTCSTPRPNINIFNRDSGALLKAQQASTVPSGIASGPTIVGDLMFVGGGTGAHNSGSDAEAEAVRDTPLSAFCVVASPGCFANTCNDSNPCTYDYKDKTGTCVSEPAADGIDCKVGTAPGTCANGTCMVTGSAPTPTPGEG
jgi:outer membrane protein assembly factor BamB